MSVSPNIDDRRAAVGMSVTLSGQLMSAALAVMALNAGFMSYVLANRSAETLYYILCIGAFFVFAASLFYGGAGIVEARNSGFIGEWNLKKGKEQFNAQAIQCLSGLLMVFLSLFVSGEPRTQEINSEISRINESVASLAQKVLEQRMAAVGIAEEVSSLQRFDENLKGRLWKIEEELGKPKAKISQTQRTKKHN